MKYMGSKRRLAKEIVPLLMSKHKQDMWYIEPFVGGCNMMEHIPAKKRFGSDSHEYLIAMWIGLRDGTFKPPTLVTEDEYKDIRENKDKYDPALVGYVGFNSYGAK
jgi:DNA adenine methylase